MATRYVSQTATNGYSIGVDSGVGTSKSSPWLTVTYALLNASAGDTIVINDGIYTDAGGFFSVTKTLTINSETDYGAILRGSNATRALNLNAAAGTVVTLGKVVVDGNNVSASCITVTSIAGQQHVWNFNKTKFRNPVNYGWNTNNTNEVINASDVIFEGCKWGFVGYSLSAGAYNIDGCIFNYTGTAQCGVTDLNATSTGVTAWVRRVVANLTSSSASVCFVVSLSNIQSTIEDCDLNLSGTCSGGLIALRQIAAVIADMPVIRRNKGVMAATGASTYLVLIGSDTAGANDNSINYPIVYQNNFVGNNTAATVHGILLANMKGGVVTDNVVSKAVIPFISKLQSEKSYWVNNRSYEITGANGHLRSKGSTSPVFVGNIADVKTGFASLMVLADKDPAIPTYTSNAAYIGNYLTSEDVVVTQAITVETSSSANFRHNNYYLPRGVSGTPWSDGASTYATLALWGAAKDVYYKSSAPALINRFFYKDIYLPIIQAMSVGKATVMAMLRAVF